MGFILSIYGEAGSGKSTIAKELSRELGYIYIDTDSIYRCITLEALKNNIAVNEIDKINRILDNILISFKNDVLQQRVMLNNIDVTEDIRTEEVDDKVAEFAAIDVIRQKLKDMQRIMGEKGNIIIEEEDICTTIFPNADLKIYIEVSEEVCVKRKYKQNIDKGINTSYEQVLENIKKRHKLETEGEVSSLKNAEDAIIINTTTMSIKESIDRIKNLMEEKMLVSDKIFNIQEMQIRVAKMVKEFNLQTSPEMRFIDLSSEIGELGKEILKGSDYGKKIYKNTEELDSEMGDVLFSLTCIANELGVSLEKALLKIMKKYRKRFEEKGDIGSNTESMQ